MPKLLLASHNPLLTTGYGRVTSVLARALGDFGKVNAVMAEYFTEPYPARSTIEASALPRGAAFEVDAILVLA